MTYGDQPSGKRRARGVLLAPSVLSCDLLRLRDQIHEVEAAGADWLHVDIMDGRFVPALTFGPNMVEALRRATDLPLDVHLMVEEPERWVAPFCDAGASCLSFHLEACRHPRRLCQDIGSRGVTAGVALNPATPPDPLIYLSDVIGLVVIMGVDPGFAGQSFIPGTLNKVVQVRRFLAGVDRTLPGRDGVTSEPPRLEVDGGVDLPLAPALVASGADVLVAGSSVFGRPSPARAVADLRQAVS